MQFYFFMNIVGCFDVWIAPIKIGLPVIEGANIIL